MVNAIDLKEFDWIQSGEHQAIGIIAQQIQSFAPELISEDASDGHLKLNTDKLVYYCIKAIQELCEKEGMRYSKPIYKDPYTYLEKKTFIAKMPSQKYLESANNVLQSLSAENASAASNIDELKSENFNSQEILSGVADIRAYLGITADDIVGIQVDYKNKTFKRLAGAANLTKGSDFDKFTMFGGRKRCNVADDGSIVAWYGDADYKEDGSMGQVMVYQPSRSLVRIRGSPILRSQTHLSRSLRRSPGNMVWTMR